MRPIGFVGILCAGVLAGCAMQPAQVKPPEAGPVITVTDVSVTELAEMTRIAVTADGPLSYTAFKLEEPLQLIVDLADTDLGAFAGPREVGLDPVGLIVAEQTGEGGRIARLSLKLSRSADYQIHRDDERTLLIDFAKEPPAPAPVEPPVAQEIEPPALPAAATTLAEPPRPAATAPSHPRITAVRIVPKPTFVDVQIEADGPLGPPKVFAVGGNRLVVDLPNARSAVKSATIKAEANTLVRQARIGQHRDPMKVRVVIDLKKAVKHTVDERGKRLTVRLARAHTAAPAHAATPPPVSQPVATVSAAESVAAPAVPAPPVPAAPPPAAPVLVATGGKTLGVEGYTGQKISLDFQDAEVSNILRLIADVSGLNMVVGEEVRGKVTLKLFNVPWDQALDIVLRTKGLGQVREGNIIRIDANANIAKQQDEAAKAKEAQIKAEDLKTLIIPINYAKAADLATTLKKNLSSRGDLTVNEPTNSLIAKDVPQNIAEIQQLIKLLDLPTPQVLIETRIVQANRNFARDLGVQWGGAATDSPGNNTNIALNAGPGTGDAFGVQVPNFAVNLPASGGAGSIGNIGFTLGRLVGTPFNLDLRLTAGEASGETKIISSPRVVTLDNKEATIQQGDSIPFETVSDKGTQTQFVDATLNLTVTPHITPNGSVIMKIKATKNAIGDFRSRLGAPSISKREAATEVMVQDGETTVIGGIFESTKAESETGVPWLSKIPGLSWLFKRQSVSDQTRELLIFITPTIVKRT